MSREQGSGPEDIEMSQVDSPTIDAELEEKVRNKCESLAEEQLWDLMRRFNDDIQELGEDILTGKFRDLPANEFVQKQQQVKRLRELHSAVFTEIDRRLQESRAGS